MTSISSMKSSSDIIERIKFLFDKSQSTEPGPFGEIPTLVTESSDLEHVWQQLSMYSDGLEAAVINHIRSKEEALLGTEPEESNQDDEPMEEEEQEEEEEGDAQADPNGQTQGKEAAQPFHFEEDDTPAETAFSRQRDKMQGRIARIEQEMMGKKDWAMTGESTEASRPHNALLSRKAVDYDSRARPSLDTGPDLEAEIERILRLRIHESIWNDPEYVTLEAAAAKKEAPAVSTERPEQGLGDQYASEFVSSALRKAGVKEALPQAILEQQDACLELYAELERDLQAFTSFFALN
eukprot:gnl/Dysnectes_brevis/2261_a2650_1359.p1 GENE.gnl/Dysnectes_brevis/2261_a2650_1359~~gnl/Dysnectes_brevis/2261_a2650_1359.p1  ORF type:complete len:295 (-),score=99.78 gnl/Dysnectes_brevis/2261_a2650_1359:37-921(-)